MVSRDAFDPTVRGSRPSELGEPGRIRAQMESIRKAIEHDRNRVSRLKSRFPDRPSFWEGIERSIADKQRRLAEQQRLLQGAPPAQIAIGDTGRAIEPGEDPRAPAQQTPGRLASPLPESQGGNMAQFDIIHPQTGAVVGSTENPEAATSQGFQVRRRGAGTEPGPGQQGSREGIPPDWTDEVIRRGISEGWIEAREGQAELVRRGSRSIPGGAGQPGGPGGTGSIGPAPGTQQGAGATPTAPSPGSPGPTRTPADTQLQPHNVTPEQAQRDARNITGEVPPVDFSEFTGSGMLGSAFQGRIPQERSFEDIFPREAREALFGGFMQGLAPNVNPQFQRIMDNQFPATNAAFEMNQLLGGGTDFSQFLGGLANQGGMLGVIPTQDTLGQVAGILGQQPSLTGLDSQNLPPELAAAQQLRGDQMGQLSMAVSGGIQNLPNRFQNTMWEMAQRAFNTILAREAGGGGIDAANFQFLPYLAGNNWRF